MTPLTPHSSITEPVCWLKCSYHGLLWWTQGTVSSVKVQRTAQYTIIQNGVNLRGTSGGAGTAGGGARRMTEYKKEMYISGELSCPRYTHRRTTVLLGSKPITVLRQGQVQTIERISSVKNCENSNYTQLRNPRGKGGR